MRSKGVERRDHCQLSKIFEEDWDFIRIGTGEEDIHTPSGSSKPCSRSSSESSTGTGDVQQVDGQMWAGLGEPEVVGAGHRRHHLRE
eukprot:CAMPEP_0206273388 /NCGR_PEP_ID=MMETSP0047_2-20121206/34571_1 /ASSEMBLY_ACC=CAM_ASM_000192 /TAXON_ID=195065 /ORGANISM="Chroomonas mesostigmatica_cf, Strain CCMP1168" /LENGTH=86 /DNA_ID=CAMNT_0053702485 /DNA_START=13 /DNA_END=270 /DNA_ORIENTATION=-